MRRAIACVVVLALAGCGDRLPGRPAEPAKETARESFERLYAGNCAGCHGDKGRLGAAPPLNDPTFLAIVPEATLAKVIRDGREGTLMPAFAKAKSGALTPEEVEQLARGLKAFWRAAKASEGLPAYAASGSGDAAAGAKAFARACAGCHGENGRGGDSAGSIRAPAFLGLLSDQVLRRLVITGRPDLGMPDYAESKGREKGFRPLSDREVTDLVALLASWRQSDGERGK
jgi:cytochrome c oxidase cbb3-type subunit 3/ubiquinol-cytochrome c reductase cytochrome c subunit